MTKIYKVTDYIAGKYIPVQLLKNLPQVSILDRVDLTVSEAAEALGLKSYDYALPQTFAEEFQRTTGEWPAGMFVWCYDNEAFGCPVPVCREGEILLRVFKHIKSQQ